MASAPAPASVAQHEQDETSVLASLEQLDVDDPPRPPISAPSGCEPPIDIDEVMQGFIANVQKTAEADPAYAADPGGAIQRAAGRMRDFLPTLMRGHLQEISNLGGGQYLTEATKQRLRGSDFLPTRAEVSTALGVTLPNPAEWQGPRAYDATTPADAQAIMAARLRRVLRRDNWFTFCYDRRRPTYEFMTRESIDAYSVHVRSAVLRALEATAGPATVLEIGAGSGRLTRWVAETVLASLDAPARQRVQFVASDNGKWGIPDACDIVEKLSYEDALVKHAPAIVLVAWMVNNADWTEAVRGTASVQDYFVSGEPSESGTATTWTAASPCGRFKGIVLKDVSSQQLCHLDTPPAHFGHNRTMWFTRR